MALLRSTRWHPETVAACSAQVGDWLADTGPHDAEEVPGAVGVVSPVSGEPTTVGDLIDAERAAAAFKARVIAAALRVRDSLPGAGR